MRFLGDAIVTVVGLLVIGAVLAYLQVMDGGLSAAEQPSVVEKAVSARLLRLSVPAEAKKASNPYAAEKQHGARGRSILTITARSATAGMDTGTRRSAGACIRKSPTWARPPLSTSQTVSSTTSFKTA